MTLKNKLGIHNSAELARQEERLSKLRAQQLFDEDVLGTFEVGTFAGLRAIHRHLFQDVYDFAGAVRNADISKGSFRFASSLYLEPALRTISAMPQGTFDEIVEKYVEMNVAHPFWEGNGRSMRIWLDAILRQELGQVVDWSRIDKEDYLAAMERSPIRDTEIKFLLKEALTDQVDDREVFMKGIDASYHYEDMEEYQAGNVPEEDEG